MGASAQGPEDFGAPMADINVTPFVDVVLVLLVIFMLTAPAIMKDTINVNLPKSKSADQKAAASIGVAITRQGQILINGQMSSFEELAEEVKRTLISQPDAQAIISADREARHGDVVRAVDVIKSAGLQRFALQVERE